MAVSVRMDVALEHELELAAKRQGITKSQFIIDAVERALGRKDSYRLLLDVQRAYGLKEPGAGRAAREPAPTSARLREKLRGKQDESMRDWLAYQDAKRRGVPWAPDDTNAAT